MNKTIIKRIEEVNIILRGLIRVLRKLIAHNIRTIKRIEGGNDEH